MILVVGKHCPAVSTPLDDVMRLERYDESREAGPGGLKVDQ